EQLRSALQAQEVTAANLPRDLAEDWVSPDGHARVEVLPQGDPNDSQVLRRFALAVLAVAPNATGAAISFYRSALQIHRAFIEAAGCAAIATALTLLITLRRSSDVRLTFVPLTMAPTVTPKLCVLLYLPLNFANILSLPLLLGVGVAFKIYY